MVYYQYIHSFLYQSAWHVNINKKILNYLKQKTTHHLVFLSQTVNSYNVIMCYLHKKLAPNMNVNPGWWLALNFNSTRPWKINIHSWNVKHSITHEHNKYRYIIHIYIYIYTQRLSKIKYVPCINGSFPWKVLLELEDTIIRSSTTSWFSYGI